MPARKVQLAVTLDDDALGLLVELFTEALNRVQAQTPKPSHLDEKRAARLRASQNALFAGQEPPTDRGLILDIRETARLLKVSPRTVYTMAKSKRMPPAIRIGSAVRWSYDELKTWIAKGCPPENE